MKKFKKDINAKIMAWALVLVFFMQAAGYGENLPDRCYLRKPMISRYDPARLQDGTSATTGNDVVSKLKTNASSSVQQPTGSLTAASSPNIEDGGIEKDITRKVALYRKRFSNEIWTALHKSASLSMLQQATRASDQEIAADRLMIGLLESIDRDERDVIADAVSRFQGQGIDRTVLMGLLLEIGDTYFARGPIDKARNVLEYLYSAAADQKKVFISASLALADLYGRLYIADATNGRRPMYSEALRVLEELLQVDPGNPSAKDLKEKVESRRMAAEELRRSAVVSGDVVAYVVPDEEMPVGFKIQHKGVKGTWVVTIPEAISNTLLLPALQAVALSGLFIDEVAIVSEDPGGLSRVDTSGKPLRYDEDDSGTARLFININFLYLSRSQQNEHLRQIKDEVGRSVRRAGIAAMRSISEPLSSTGQARVALMPLHALSNLGSLTLAEHLRSQGITVLLPDSLPLEERLASDTVTVDYQRMIRSFAFAESPDKAPNIIGISISNYADISRVLRMIHSSGIDAFIVLGGPNTDYIEELMVDCPGSIIIIRGDGEEAMASLCRVIGATRPSQGFSEQQWQMIERIDAKGLFVRQPYILGGKVVGSRVVTRDLDIKNIVNHFSLPDVDLMGRAMNADDLYVARVMLTRGCPFRCAFCNLWMGNTARTLNPHAFIDWLRKLAERDDVREKLLRGEKLAVMIEDDNFLVNKELARVVMQGIINYGLERYFHFDCQASMESFRNGSGRIDGEFIALMRKAGFRKIGIGVDGTTNEHIVLQKNRRRPYRIEDVFAVNETLKKEGLTVWNFHILTNPYTTLRMFFKSLVVYYTSGLFIQPIADDADVDLSIQVHKIFGNIGSPFNNEDIMHYPQSNLRERVDLTYIDPLVSFEADTVSTNMGTPDAILAELNKIYEVYPEYLQIILEEMLQEQDTQLQALALIILYYISSAHRLSKRITFAVLMSDIAGLMKESGIYTYQQLAQRIDLLEGRITNKPDLENGESFEEEFVFWGGIGQRILSAAGASTALSTGAEQASIDARDGVRQSASPDQRHIGGTSLQEQSLNAGDTIRSILETSRNL